MQTSTEYTEDPNVNDEAAYDTEAIDISQIQGSPSDSVNKNTYPALAPGTYVSPDRSITHAVKSTEKDGTPYISFKLAFSPFLKEDGEPVKQKPPFCNVNTLPRKDGGLTSVADYLLAFGIDGRLLAGQPLIDEVMSTQDKPVKVRTGIVQDWKTAAPGTRKKRDDFFKQGDRYFSEAKDPITGDVIKGWAEVYGFRKY